MVLTTNKSPVNFNVAAQQINNKILQQYNDTERLVDNLSVKLDILIEDINITRNKLGMLEQFVGMFEELVIND